MKPEHPSPLLPEIARDSVWTADVPAGLSNVLTLYDGEQSSTPGMVEALHARGVRGSDDSAEPDRLSLRER